MELSRKNLPLVTNKPRKGNKKFANFTQFLNPSVSGEQSSESEAAPESKQPQKQGINLLTLSKPTMDSSKDQVTVNHNVKPDEKSDSKVKEHSPDPTTMPKDSPASTFGEKSKGIDKRAGVQALGNDNVQGPAGVQSERSKNNVIEIEKHESQEVTAPANSPEQSNEGSQPKLPVNSKQGNSIKSTDRMDSPGESKNIGADPKSAETSPGKTEKEEKKGWFGNLFNKTPKTPPKRPDEATDKDKQNDAVNDNVDEISDVVKEKEEKHKDVVKEKGEKKKDGVKENEEKQKDVSEDNEDNKKGVTKKKNDTIDGPSDIQSSSFRGSGSNPEISEQSDTDPPRAGGVGSGPIIGSAGGLDHGNRTKDKNKKQEKTASATSTPTLKTKATRTPMEKYSSKLSGHARDQNPMEEQHLRAIWRELGIGKDGYLTLPELSTVCRHIGMTNMSDKELKELFSNLDTDNDARVSFSEFMKGLFQHSPKDAIPPSRSSKTTLPTIISQGSGMFTAIDNDGMGHARPAEIVDYWKRIGIPNGASLLTQMGFDPKASKLPLDELSQVLEVKLFVDDNNTLHKTAVVSCQHEIKNLKFVKGQVESERETYRHDLIQANARIVNLQSSWDDNKFQSVEEKYRDEIRHLNIEIENLKDSQGAELSQQRRSMENVIIGLKEEETSLKEKVSELTSDVNRLEQESADYMEQLAHFDNLTSKQQQELDSLANLHAKVMLELASMSNTEELRDANDELIMEVEMLRHQVTSTNNVRTNSKEPISSPHNQKAKGPSDIERGSGRPAEPFPDYYEFNVHEKLKKDFDFMKNKYRAETAELRNKLESARMNFDLELKDEIADLQDHYERKIDQMSQNFNKEKDSLLSDLERKKAELEANVRQELEERHQSEREMLEARFEAERLNIERKHETDKQDVVKQLEQDYQDELRRRMEGIRDAVDKEKHNTSGHMSRMKDDWETQKRLIREELALQFSKETQAMRERFTSDKARMEQVHKTEIQEYEQMLEKGERALTGKLRHDFDAIMERHRQKLREEEETNSTNRFLREKSQLQEEHEAELARLRMRERQAFTEEKRELMAEYERRIARYEAEASLVPSSLVEEFDHKLENAKLTFTSEVETLSERNRLLEDRLSEQDITRTMCEQYKKRGEDLAERNKRLEAEVRAIEEKLSSVTADNQEALTSARTDRASLKLEYELKNEELRKDKEKLTKSLMDIEDTLNTKDEEISKLKGIISDMKTDLEKQRLNLTKKIDTLSVENGRLHEQLLQKQEVLRQLKAEIDRQNLSLSKQHDTLSINNSRLHEQLLQKQEVISELKAEKDQLKLNLTKEQDTLKLENVRLQEQLLQKQEVVRELKSGKDMKELNWQNQLDGLTRDKARLQEQSQQDQNRIVAYEQEKNVLRRHLHHAEDQISQLTDKLSSTEKEHLQDLQEARDRLAGYIDINKFNETNDQLVRAEKKIQELELLLKKNSSGNDKALAEAQNAVKSAVREAVRVADEAHDATKKKLEITKDMLREKVDLLKHEMEENRRASRMAEGLFKENAGLIRTVQSAEDHSKKSEQLNKELEQKCHALQRCLKKMVRDGEDGSIS